MAKLKTPEYSRRAINKYQAGKDKASVLLPLGTKDRIRTLTGESTSGFINRVVAAELERIESNQWTL